MDSYWLSCLCESSYQPGATRSVVQEMNAPLFGCRCNDKDANVGARAVKPRES